MELLHVKPLQADSSERRLTCSGLGTVLPYLHKAQSAELKPLVCRGEELPSLNKVVGYQENIPGQQLTHGCQRVFLKGN